jgi:hypothetical protein
MKTLKIVASLLLSICAVGSIANASTAQKKTAKQKSAVNMNSAVKPSRQAKLGTSFKMDGTALRGKYQSSLGTRATVENDKSLDDLLTGRTQFDDRIQQDSEKN